MCIRDRHTASIPASPSQTRDPTSSGHDQPVGTAGTANTTPAGTAEEPDSADEATTARESTGKPGNALHGQGQNNSATPSPISTTGISQTNHWIP